MPWIAALLAETVASLSWQQLWQFSAGVSAVVAGAVTWYAAIATRREKAQAIAYSKLLDDYKKLADAFATTKSESTRAISDLSDAFEEMARVVRHEWQGDSIRTGLLLAQVRAAVEKREVPDEEYAKIMNDAAAKGQAKFGQFTNRNRK